MPNPRLTFRVPEEILQQLPEDADERSRFCLEAVVAKLNPPSPDDELAALKARVETIERQLGLR